MSTNAECVICNLLQSSKVEDQLTMELQTLRDQCSLRKSSLQDHQSSLEVLRDEVSIPLGFDQMINYNTSISRHLGLFFNVETSNALLKSWFILIFGVLSFTQNCI